MKQLKYLKDNLKRCLGKRTRLTRSGAAATLLPKCQFFDQMAFLHEKSINRPSVSNVLIPNFKGQSNVLPGIVPINNPPFVPPYNPTIQCEVPLPPSPASSITFNSSHSTGKQRKTSTTTDMENTSLVMNELSKLEGQLQKVETEESDYSLFCRSLIPTLEKLDARKNKIARIKLSQLLFELEFDEICN